MTQPAVELRTADPEYLFTWLKKMFYELRLLRSNKLTIELIRPDDGRKPFIKVTRRG